MRLNLIVFLFGGFTYTARRRSFSIWGLKVFGVIEFLTCMFQVAGGQRTEKSLVSQRWEEGLLNRVLADFRPILQFAQQG